jgi:uncharacterized cupredoxin-like copper-binding protein
MGGLSDSPTSFLASTSDSLGGTVKKYLLASIFVLPLLAGSALIHVDAALAAGPAPSVVKIDMTDATVDASLKNMVMKAEPQTVKAGPVAFEVSNSSKSLIHEMIVVSVSDPNSPLPYDDKANRVIESKIKHLGEASDLKPGTKKTLKLTLKPGSYLLICNQVGHYHQGMTTTFTVTQ